MIVSLKAGEIFSGCKLLQKCGKGAYGIVYLAENAIGQKIIIKIAGTNGNPERELQGVRYYMRVSGSHPNLLQIFHIGEMEGGFFYTMEAADDLGSDPHSYTPATLGNMLRQGKCFSPEEAVNITRDLLKGVDVLHRNNLVHRDIKPDNIIFVNGVPKLSDPGLVTEAGSQATLVGTPGFIPPEIISSGFPTDQKSDLYALGKVFYCMVTGKRPGEYPHLPETLPLEIRRQLFPGLCRMCNTNASKRFRSVEEFLKELPEKLEAPSWWEKKYKYFLDWKDLNREMFRFLTVTFAGIFLLILLVFAAVIYRQKEKEALLAFQEEKVRDFLAVNKDRRELIPFQIKLMLPEILPEVRKKEGDFEKAVKKKEWEKASAIAGELSQLYRSGAGKLLPRIPEKIGDFQKDLISAGKARGFKATPLYTYLPKEEKAGYKKRLLQFEKKLYAGWNGPRCHGEWSNYSFYSFVFLGPGGVKMPHTGKIVAIPYHFWIGKTEVSSAWFTRMTQLAPQYSREQNTPVERILWNDVLFYCWRLTRSMRFNGVLPPGYIVRPPTESEWEYAAQNGWLGKDRTPFAQRAVFAGNSNRKSQPSGSLHPNKLGVYDMYGNVYEIVKPISPPVMKHSVIIRGGSFKTSEKACYGRIELQKYQNIPHDIGFRVVLAPGNMDYFDKHFFLGGGNTLRTHGRIFELVGENLGCFNWETSRSLCRLLGGRLAELDSPELLNKIQKEMPLAVAGWPCFLGGWKKDGKWCWISSGKEIRAGKWDKSRFNTGNFLTLQSKRWKPAAHTRSGILLCQWDEKAFPHRNKQLEKGTRLPGELLRFTVDGRKYMLVDFRMGWYTARRVCELLGGELASLDTPELRKKVTEKLSAYRSKYIFLGGYAKREKWFWLSGGEITFPLEKSRDVPIPTINRNFVSLKEGKFYNSQYADYFLCEWPAKRSSSN